MNARELSVERLLSGRRAQRGAKLRIEGERLFAVEQRALIRERLAPRPASPEAQVALVEEIAAAVSSRLVTVQFGPAAVQWCSEPLLRAIAERSAATGRRIHMHLLETRYQRE